MLSYRRIYLIGCYLLWEKLHQKFSVQSPNAPIRCLLKKRRSMNRKRNTNVYHTSV